MTRLPPDSLRHQAPVSYALYFIGRSWSRLVQIPRDRWADPPRLFWITHDSDESSKRWIDETMQVWFDALRIYAEEPPALGWCRGLSFVRFGPSRARATVCQCQSWPTSHVQLASVASSHSIAGWPMPMLPNQSIAG